MKFVFDLNQTPHIFGMVEWWWFVVVGHRGFIQISDSINRKKAQMYFIFKSKDLSKYFYFRLQIFYLVWILSLETK